MKRTIGVTARGIICPIIRKGDDLVSITVRSVLDAANENGFELKDKDIVCITESVVARSQGNYATVDDIAADIIEKFGEGAEIGIVLPIFSRNRFAVLLRGFARAAKKLYIFMSSVDEVGNTVYLPMTGVNYADYYASICKEENCEAEVFPEFIPENLLTETVLRHTKNILVSNVHLRERVKGLFVGKADKIYTMADILSTVSDKHGYNTEFGLLGTNKVDENTVKLFPRDATDFCYKVQALFKKETGRTIEIGVYGDGCFKSPYSEGGVSVWEFADPLTLAGYTNGLEGKPNEVKIKYLADDKYKDLSGDELKAKIQEEIAGKEADLTGNMKSQGTTPRKIRDLVGSLCDLVSGSGDKGTPIVLIQGYFDNYATK